MKIIIKIFFPFHFFPETISMKKMKLSTLIEVLLILIIIAFAASKPVDNDTGNKNKQKKRFCFIFRENDRF